MEIPQLEEESKIMQPKAKGPQRVIRTHAPTKDYKKNSLTGVKSSVFISDHKILKDGLFSGSYVTF